MAPRTPVLLYSELRVRRLDRSLRFYRALGLREIARGTTPDGISVVWLRDGRSGHVLQLFHLARGARLYRPYRSRNGLDFQLMFGVVDDRPLLARLRRAGGRSEGSLEDGGIRLTTVRDPDGHYLEILAWTPDRRPRPTEPPQYGILRLKPPTRRRR